MNTNKKLNPTTRHYDAFIEQMRMEGVDEFHANQLPQAREAYEKDQHDDYQRVIKAPAESFYNWQVIASREYRDSPTMRQAVQRMAENSPCMTAPQVPVEDKLMAGARKDAMQKMYKQLVKDAGHDPVKRVELIECLKSDSPEVQAMITEGERSIDGETDFSLAMKRPGVRHVGSELGQAMSNPGKSLTPVEVEARNVQKATDRQQLFADAFAAGIDMGPDGGQK